VEGWRRAKGAKKAKGSSCALTCEPVKAALFALTIQGYESSVLEVGPYDSDWKTMRTVVESSR
jgi:hypothetical protein